MNPLARRAAMALGLALLASGAGCGTGGTGPEADGPEDVAEVRDAASGVVIAVGHASP